MRKFLVALTVVVFVVSATGSAMALTVTSMDTAEGLVNAMLGSGISISNVSYTGATAASGYFTGGNASGIGIDEGIVLTSGYASNVDGLANTSDGITGDNGLVGDPDLDALIPGYSTNDATVLEFDFESVGGDVYFNYVFGSDEYNEWVNSSFNDVFGFFLDDANIALLPDATTPVSINNVNNGSNSDYYNNNDPSDTSTPFAFEYDGFTNVLTASFEGLSAGTHHIKLAIADAGDHVLDSGVFIQAGTFSDVPTDPDPVPEPSTVLLLGAGLIGLLGLGRKKMSK